jgi:putative heme-binding domain-containing protein
MSSMSLARSALALLLTASLLPAAEDKVFTQKPAVAPSQVRGDTAPPPMAEPKDKDRLLEKGPTPLWLWGADLDKRYFLKKEFEGGSTSARLIATCDNEFTLWLNGQEVARSTEWQQPVTADVQKHLKPGANVLLAEVINHGGAAGFVMKLAMQTDKEPRYVVTDETWTVSEKKDERGVAPRKTGKLGDAPWGNVFVAAPRPGGLPANVFSTLPGFQVERLFTVPKDQLGSWVSITADDKGRLYASDQEKKGICRITPPPIGSDQPTRVERLDVNISGAQGMLWAFNSLYLSINGGPGSGLYRLHSTRDDGQLDQVTKLKAINGGGEHGPHGLRLSPDGKSIFLVAGNHTRPPEKFDASRLPSNWNEDHILPRQWDANGHARGILAPGGWIAKTDPDGKTWEMFSSGYRNVYDIAFNADGELFAYDSDMEWDMGMPWYRPTRVTHATSGSEFGWRSGSGKWPAYYPDSLPPLLDIGPGSPVGVEFGYRTKFPAKYQKALYLCDWTFGTIYALHLEPEGSSYKAVKEEFLSRTPLPLTDIAVGGDGALYFTIGGRGAQSELFRVTYTGKEPTAPVDYREPRNKELRELRHRIEEYHRQALEPATVVAFLYSHLGHADRFIRYAARVALEQRPALLWQERVLAEKDPQTLLTGAIALARQGDKSLQGNLLAALDRLDFAALPEAQQLELLRAWQLVCIRMGEPDKDTAARLAKKLDGFYPAKSDPINRELCQLLVYLKSPTVARKTIAMIQGPDRPTPPEGWEELIRRNSGYGGPIAKMLANAPDLQKLSYAFALRNLREGWTLAERKVYFQFLADARLKSGGASYVGFLNNIEKDAYENASETERVAIEAAGLRKPFKPKELPKPAGPGGRDWTTNDLAKFAETRLTGRDYKNGEKMYAAARCIVCHRFYGDGGATGPDLTQVAGRFNLKDLCESIVEPSKVIPDLYRGSIVTTASGKTITGRIIGDSDKVLTILTDPEDSTKVVEVKKSDVEEVKPSPTSLMPKDLLKPLGDNEVLDLLAYLLARGDPKHVMFKK